MKAGIAMVEGKLCQDRRLRRAFPVRSVLTPRNGRGAHDLERQIRLGVQRRVAGCKLRTAFEEGERGGASGRSAVHSVPGVP
jgi:hypothetical protein